MNLPNYFLADLPPEATLSPVMISEACQTLKRNREQYLANRSLQSVANLFVKLGDAWLQPDFPFRKYALENAAATGFSRVTLERGLDGIFGQLTRESFRDLIAQEFDDAADVLVPATGTSGTPSRFWRGPEF